ncbi:MAG: tetratricopeptide repeat protein [Bacteroidetes bacterium]|nr:tetratricopeptide repeat protein [Bacteroidota bacterium]
MKQNDPTIKFSHFISVLFYLFFIIQCRSNDNSKRYEKYIDAKTITQKIEIGQSLSQKEKQCIDEILKIIHNQNEKENKQSKEKFEKAIRWAEEQNYEHLKIWLQVQYAQYLYQFRNMPQSLPIVIRLSDEINKIPEEDLIHPEESFRFIGYYLSTIQQHQKSIHFLKQSVKNTMDQNLLAALYDNIGIGHLRLKNYKEAEKHFSQALEIAERQRDTIRIAKIYGNQALLYWELKQGNKAIGLLLKDIEFSKKENALQNQMFAQIALGKIYWQQNNPEQAEKILKEAYNIALSKDTYKSSELEILKILTPIAILKNDIEQEITWRRKIDHLEKILKNYDGPETIEYAKYNAQIAAINHEKEKEEAKIKVSQYKNNFLIALLLFSIIGGVLLLQAINKKLKAEKAEHQNWMLHSEIEKIKSENKLKETQHSIDSYKQYLKEKNQQIEKLNAELLQLEKSKSVKNIEKIADVRNMLDSHLMTDENWFKFKDTFILAYPEYYSYLTENFDELTESNMRLIILLKLGIPPIEITHLLGISTEAIKKAKQRLKKKLGQKYESLFANENP